MSESVAQTVANQIDETTALGAQAASAEASAENAAQAAGLLIAQTEQNAADDLREERDAIAETVETTEQNAEDLEWLKSEMATMSSRITEMGSLITVLREQILSQAFPSQISQAEQMTETPATETPAVEVLENPSQNDVVENPDQKTNPPQQSRTRKIRLI